MIKKVFLLATAAICVLFNVSKAQDPYADASHIPSPENSYDANSDGIVNVDKFTGIANVNIPIWNYSLDGLDLGVSLAYNAKGVLVDAIASNVGLGWDVNAGGSIYRTVNGLEDEVTIPTNPSPVTIHSFHGYPGGTVTMLMGLQAVGATNELRGSWVNPASTPATVQTYETEYDNFTASFGGRNIDFVIDNTGVVTTNPHANIKIKVLLNGTEYPSMHLPAGVGTALSDTLSFVITDEKGNQFYFSSGDYQIKQSPNGNSYYSTNKWNLTKVTTITGKVVTYTYLSHTLNYPQYQNDSVQEKIVAGAFTEANAYTHPVYWDGKATELYLINYPNGTTVTFDPIFPDHERCDLFTNSKLNSIEISQSYDATVSHTITYTFNHAFFNSIKKSMVNDNAFSASELPYVDQITCSYLQQLENDGFASADAKYLLQRGLRLKLKSITRSVDDGPIEPYFAFIYDSSAKLPLRLSSQQDWFGYFNNTDTNIYNATAYNAPGISIPLHTIDGVPIGVDRTPDANYLKAFTLNQIVSGHGGEVDLFYQAPPSLLDTTASYTNQSTPDGFQAMNTFDGLCIDHVTYKDGYNNSNTVTDNYSFTNGLRFFRGGYFYYPTWFNTGTTFIIHTNHFVTPLDFFRNSNHGYSDVSVQRINANNELVSRKDYHYTNLLDNSGISYLTDDKMSPTRFVFPRVEFDKNRIGLNTSIKDYGNTNDVVSKTTLEYVVHDYTPLKNASPYEYILEVDPIEPGPGSNYYDSNTHRTYNIFDPSAINISSQKTYNYSSGSEVLKLETDYLYDGQDNLSQKSWLDSKGATYTTTYTYDYSLTNLNTLSSTPAINAIASNISSMNTAGYQYLISEETVKDAAKVIHYTQTIPSYSGGKIVSATNAISTLNEAPTISSFHQFDPITNLNFNYLDNYNSQVGNLSNFTQYDDHSNCVESWSGINQRYFSSIYDNRIGKVVASISNAQYAEVAYTSFEGTFASLGVTDYNKGHWAIDPGNVVLATNGDSAITGKYYYRLPLFASIYPDITPSAKPYLLTFWCNGTVPQIKYGLTTLTPTLQLQVGSWKLYTVYFTSNGTDQLNIKAGLSATKIDELHLHPANAVMNTYTYEPLLGLSSHTDERNNINYYEYDSQGRFSIQRDINGNILSLKKHTLQGTDN
jgi:hypothetical protein